MIIPSEEEATLMLGPVRTSDSGSYSCGVTVNVNFLTSSITQTSGTFTIAVRGELIISVFTSESRGGCRSSWLGGGGEGKGTTCTTLCIRHVSGLASMGSFMFSVYNYTINFEIEV